MSSKIKAQIVHIFKTLTAVSARIPSEVERGRVTADIQRLMKQSKKTVDNDQLSVILKQAQGKLVMARIRYKDIIQDIEKQEEETPFKSEAEVFQEAAKEKEQNRYKQFEESTRNQQKVAEAYRKIGDQIERDTQGLLQEIAKNKAELEEAWEEIHEGNHRAQKRREEATKGTGGLFVGKENVRLEGEELFKETEKKVDKLQLEQDSKIAGFINVDPMSGNFEFQKNEEMESETYVIRKGKLVKGKAKKREEAQFTNWHGGNADPEDILRHREMLDRQHYKGPVWENQRPKSILESDLGQIAMQEGEQIPEGAGQQSYETVVR